jgi:RHS repeat-associated protein
VDGAVATYTYGPDGERVRKDANGVATEYIYFQGNAIAEKNPGTGAWTDYIFGYAKRLAKDTSANGTGAQYYQDDQLGSARIMTDSAGTVISNCTFNPFGEQVGCSPDNPSNHYRFSGKERDSESGLDDFGARYAGPSFGRFLSPDWSEDPDPVPYAESSSPQSLNGYIYVLNNPISRIDQEGHDCIYANGKGGGELLRGDCKSDTDDGVFVNGTVDKDSFTYDATNNRSGYTYTTDSGVQGKGVLQGPDLNAGFPAGSLAAGVFGASNAPIWRNADGAANFLGKAEFTAVSLFFPVTGFIVEKIAGAPDDQDGYSAAAISRKPGSLGKFKGADALRQENKMARDIMKELNLGKDLKREVHEIISEEAIMAGRKLTFNEALAAVKAALKLK